MNPDRDNSSRKPVRTRDRVSTVLFINLAVIALVVLTGLVFIAFELVDMQNRISDLRDQSLPRIIKLSQLSQEASASIAIAPALSTNPSRYEFETLLSRIEDKKGSQSALLVELRELIADEDAAANLRRNSELLTANQTALTTVVRQQINVRKKLETYVDTLRKAMRDIRKQTAISDPGTRQALFAASRLQSVLLDANRARFSRNRREILAEFENVAPAGSAEDIQKTEPSGMLLRFWSDNGDRILEDKATGLRNEFKIKALVEENSLLANRLLSSANAEFSRANEQLTVQIKTIESATRFNLAAMISVVLAFLGGAVFLWLTLQKRVFRRLDNMRNQLAHYSENRDSGQRDPTPDEIGEISRAMTDYMATIDAQEDALTEKTKNLENLSARLSKYLSPQVYESIFTGKQKVTVASSRKKLTIFFSDIVGFTELADQQESEELTKLLNKYLTEMSHIALEYGATIDKFIGDAIMVFFGDPDSRGVKKDAIRCVEMAIAMRDRLAGLNENWRQGGLSKSLECRMGIHTGFCTVGNFGSEERMEYTIIGGTVNTASRLESSAKPGQILISYETFALVCDEIDCSEEGPIEVKGIAYPVRTYSVSNNQNVKTDSDTRFHESRKGMQLEIDRKATSLEDRQAMIESLQRAIRHLNN